MAEHFKSLEIHNCWDCPFYVVKVPESRKADVDIYCDHPANDHMILIPPGDWENETVPQVCPILKDGASVITTTISFQRKD